MKTALWIIAICEIVRAIQNTIQLHALHHDKDARANAYKAFVDSLHDTDREFVQKMLKEFEEQEKDG